MEMDPQERDSDLGDDSPVVSQSSTVHKTIIPCLTTIGLNQRNIRIPILNYYI